MLKNLSVSSSPHLRDRASTRSLMLDVCIALIPAGLAAVWFFGLRVLILIGVSVLSAVAAEAYYQKKSHQSVTVSDLSAVVTGILLAYNLPANAPWWMAAIGSILAIVLIKQIFGGIGQNFMNPALAARAILFVSWMALMAKYPEAAPGNLLIGLTPDAVDTVSKATPLMAAGEAAAGSVTSLAGLTGLSLWQVFLGQTPGVLGETSKLALLIGFAYLLFRRVISWRIPVTFIGTAFLCYLVKESIQAPAYAQALGGTAAAVGTVFSNSLYQILSGGLFIGAIFMATDYATSPMTNAGKIIMGVGCGVLLFVIRSFSAYPEGCSFAILFMNVATPLIDRLTMPKTFGEVKQHA